MQLQAIRDYKEYIFGHSDSQTIFLIYLIFIHGSWFTAPQILGISSVIKAKKSSF